jgi:hypothetical protein
VNFQRLLKCSCRWYPWARLVRRPGSPSAYPLYFLALAQFGAEQTDEARQTLDRALKSTESELSQSQPPAWNRKHTLELLQQEATETIRSDGE